MSLVGSVVKARSFGNLAVTRCPGRAAQRDRQPVGGDADPGIDDAQPQAFPRQPLDRDQHLSSGRKPDRVRQEIDQDLAHLRGIAEEPWRISRNFCLAIDVNSPCHLLDGAEAGRDRAGHRDLFSADMRLFGLGPRNIEDAADASHEVLAALGNDHSVRGIFLGVA